MGFYENAFLTFLICLFDFLPNGFLIFKRRNLDLKYLMKIQCAKYKEKKNGKEN